MSDEPKTPFWARLFGPSGASGDKPATYRELVSRVEVLEGQLGRAEREADRYRRRVVVSRRENDEVLERYRVALEWYADLSNWRPYGFASVLKAIEDRGHRARRALGRMA